jgi:Fe-Mn family superoxide dismutase
MKQFTPKTFNIPALKGISAKNIEEHLKLYQGYVNNANKILEKTPEYSQWSEKDPFVTYFTNELSRRFTFEYNGMRNHEVYFASLEGGAAAISEGALKAKIAETWGSFDAWLASFKNMAATTRGIGWAVLWYDAKDDRLLTSWIDEQHFGELNGCTMILGLDMWEHSYVADYQPSGKKNYVEDFFVNLNWSVIEKNFEETKR